MDIIKLSQCLSYDPETGILTWKTRPDYHFKSGSKSPAHQASIWNAKHAGEIAFCGIGSHGYCSGTIGGKRMIAHRVAWALQTGSWPKGEIDHINGVKTDNRFVNLRDVSRSENARNLKVSSGAFRGVYWYAPTRRWVAKINAGGKMLHLGYHKCLGKAMAARRDAEVSFGFHANHGRAF